MSLESYEKTNVEDNVKTLWDGVVDTLGDSYYEEVGVGDEVVEATNVEEPLEMTF